MAQRGRLGVRKFVASLAICFGASACETPSSPTVALFGNPAQVGHRGLRAAQARVIETEADLNEQKIEKNRRSLDAQKVVGAAFQDALTFKNPDGSTRPGTQAEVMPKLGPLFQNLADTTGASPDQIGGLFRAFTGMTGDEQLSRAGFVAAGGAPGGTLGVIESRISGDFTGWDGETIFQLQNGQIWQQARYAYRYRYAYAPRVKIIALARGHELIVDGMDERLPVRRLR